MIEHRWDRKLEKLSLLFISSLFAKHAYVQFTFHHFAKGTKVTARKFRKDLKINSNITVAQKNKNKTCSHTPADKDTWVAPSNKI